MVDQPEAALTRQLRPDADLRPLRLDVQPERREPVPETAVDGLLGGPERRDGLAALADVLQLRIHHPPEKAAAPVRGKHADDRDAGARHRTRRQRQLERVRACAGDDPAVVEDGVHPLEREDLREALRVLRGRLPAEVVSDRSDRGDELLEVADGADAVRHPAILVSGRSGSVRL